MAADYPLIWSCSVFSSLVPKCFLLLNCRILTYRAHLRYCREALPILSDHSIQVLTSTDLIVASCGFRYQLWQPLPPVPVEYSEALGFGCAVLSGCNLYLFGGKDPVKGSMRRVVYYSAQTNKWHRAKGMQRRRHFFGFCVINNCLFVAGGECEGVQRSLRSAEMYDPNRKKWCYISDMSTAMVPFIGVVFGGRSALSFLLM
jgi:hypothetical protein